MGTGFHLSAPLPGTLAEFVHTVAQIAERDFYAGRRTRRSGKSLCKELCIGWRHGHARLASTVYNATRWSLELHVKEGGEG